MLGSLAVLLALGAAPALGASLTPAAPPDTLSVTYPGGDVAAGQGITVGVYNIDVPNSAYGFAWDTNVSVRVPNGTQVFLGGVFTGCGWFTAANAGSPGPNSFTSTPSLTNETGIYTIIWNQTYGTVANLTSEPNNPSTCNLSQPLSYQSWIFDANVTVVAQNVPTPTQTGKVFTLSPTPTGNLWVPNAANQVPFSVYMLLGSALLAILQV